MKKILPLVLLLIGAGAGVGAGIMLRPDAPAQTTEAGDAAAEGSTVANKAVEASTENREPKNGAANTNEYAKLNNQFVVPIISGEKVTALVVLALSVEVLAGQTSTVYEREPRLRDSFLQILFDHANMGGFEGNFTNAQVLGPLRTALREVAQKDLGKALVKDVLIVEIARQDY